MFVSYWLAFQSIILVGYYLTVCINDFWLLSVKLIPLIGTVTDLALYLVLGLISKTKWQFFLQVDKSFQKQRCYGSMLEGEADDLNVPMAFPFIQE